MWPAWFVPTVADEASATMVFESVSVKVVTKNGPLDQPVELKMPALKPAASAVGQKGICLTRLRNF
jgi:hypothetical protein